MNYSSIKLTSIHKGSLSSNNIKEMHLSLMERIFILVYFCLFFSCCNSKQEPALSFTFREFGQKATINSFMTDSVNVCVIPAFWSLDSIVYVGSDTPMKIKQGEIATINGKNDKVTFYLSEIESILISTESGSLESIHSSEDKSHKEKAKILVYDKNGNCLVNDDITLRGHGNATWKSSSQKKSYNIKFKKKTKIFDLIENKQFCLISNNSDLSHLRNWTAYECSKLLRPEMTVGYRHVALWINGDYRGLYLLTNKVNAKLIGLTDLEKQTEECNHKKFKEKDISTVYAIDSNYPDDEQKKGIENAVNPDDITGGYLLEMYPGSIRQVEIIREKSGFRSSYETRIGIKSPEYATMEQVDYIKAYYDNLFESLLSPNGLNSSTHRHYTSYLDLDDFARLYILQEMFANSDCVKGLFLYKNPNYIDSCLHAGPLWDMDATMGHGGRCHHLTNALYANTHLNLAIDQRKLQYPTLFEALSSHDDFNEEVSNIYFSIYKQIQNLFFNDRAQITDSICKVIQSDVLYDAMRYGIDISAPKWREEVKKQCRFMLDRMNFLSELWSKRSDYYCVTLDIKAETAYNIVKAYVKKDSLFTIPQIDNRKAFFADGVICKPSIRINKDMTIIYHPIEIKNKLFN